MTDVFTGPHMDPSMNGGGIIDPNLGPIQELGWAIDEQLNKVIYNEAQAKAAFKVAMLTGGNLLLSGPPGGGKTDLAKYAISLVDGLTMDDLAVVPAESDLTPIRLQGGIATTTKEIWRSDEEKDKEVISAAIGGLITARTAILLMDEINRVNPFAVNAVLPVLADRELVTTAGVTPLDRMLMAILTMNPSENQQGTFPVSDANASRMNTGAAMGIERDPAVRADTIAQIGQAPRGVAKKQRVRRVEPVVGLDRLEVMREQVARIPMPTNSPASRRYVEVVARGMDTLRDLRISDEADGRFATHVVANAGAVAALDAKPYIDDISVERGAAMALAGRIGARSRKAARVIPEATNNMLSA